MTKAQHKAIRTIVKACDELGWQIAFTEDTEIIEGIVVGTTRYVDYILHTLFENAEVPPDEDRKH